MQGSSKDATIQRVREKKLKTCACCINTIMVKLPSADKLHCANQRVDNNYPARAGLMVGLSACSHTRYMVFRT